MSVPDEVGGVFDVIDTEEHVAPQPTPEPKQTQTPAEAPKTEAKPETNTPAVGDSAKEEATQDFSREPTEPVPETPAAEPSQTETKKEAEPEVDWKATLPPPPPAFDIAPPQVNEEGQITNMNAEEYQQYIVEKAKAEMRQEAYASAVENRALDEAEKILPEIKTDPKVRAMIQNIRTASIISGQQVDSFEAAKQVKELLSGYKALGANNAKTQITITKNSAIETQGSSQKKAAPSKDKNLEKRLKAGDDSAFEELFGTWQEEGKI
jgi:hypothetical protein